MSENFDFKQKCDDILQERKKTSLSSKSLWDDYLSHGTGNNVVAGEHEDRDVLELLQNARDAIVSDNDIKGRILIAVTDKGMIIANTGAPFDLEDEKVFQAVTLLGESSKTEEKQMIGHKGIGMKSILQRFGKFSIHTHLKDHTELTALFSRARTWDELSPLIENSEIKEYVWSHLPKLPLFRTPHHAVSNKDDLFNEVRQGLSNLPISLGQFNIDEYTTSLSLYYKDSQWEDSLREVECQLFGNAKQSFSESRKTYQTAVDEKTSQDKLWEMLKDPGKLDPRTFILLGHITQIQMVNFKRTDDNLIPSEIRTYNIEGNSEPSEALPKKVLLTEHCWNNGEITEKERGFLVFSKRFDDKTGEYVRLLFEKPGEKPEFSDQPIYLYYPIQAANSGLPFLIHGPFLVTPSRKELSNNDFARKINWEVISIALELLKTSLPALLAEPDYCNWMPWMILPIFPLKNQNADPILGNLGKRVVYLIKDSACVPPLKGGIFMRPGEVCFIPERPNAFTLFEIGTDIGALPIMAKPNREQYSKDFEKAAEDVGFGKFPIEFLFENLNNFADELEADVAKEYFTAICYLLNKESIKQTDKDIARKIGEKSIPLFPISMGSKYHLVEALARNYPTGLGDGNQNLRIVFRIKGDKTERPPLPPQGINVYFVDPTDFANDTNLVGGTLDKYSQEWDINEYVGNPDLFKRVSERLDEIIDLSNDNVILPTLGYLAGLLLKINPGEKDVLFPRPYSAINTALLERYLDKNDKSNALQEITRMQDWRHKVPLPVTDESKFRLIKEVVFGHEWALFLENYSKGDNLTETDFDDSANWGKAVHALEIFRKEVDDGCVEIAGPKNFCWEGAYIEIRKIHPLLNINDQQLALFKLLLLLGVRIGPRVEWRWLSKSGNGLDAIGSVESKSAFHIQPQESFLGSINSDLVKKYTELIQSFYKPDENIIITGRGDRGTQDINTCPMYAWIWFKDLESGNLISPKLFTDCLEPIWKDIEGIFDTGWFFGDGSRWSPGKKIPSLAKFQLQTIPIWTGKITESGPAKVVFFPWLSFLSDGELQRNDFAAKYLPAYEILGEYKQNRERKLEKLSFDHPKKEAINSLYKLNWLLQNETTRDRKKHWGIPALDRSLQSVCYKLLKKIKDGNVQLDKLLWPVFIIPAVLDMQWYAVPLSDKEFAGQLRFFEHSPRPWESQKIKNRLLVMTNQGAVDEDLRSWLKELGAKPIDESAPEFDGEFDDSEAARDANKQIIDLLNSKKLLLHGIFKSIPNTDANKKSELLKNIIDGRKIKAVKKADGMEWAYQDGDKNLIYFMEDYRIRDVAVIAFGLAQPQQLDLPGSVSDLTLALTANAKIIEWELKRKGIDITSRRDLIQERLNLILAMLNQEDSKSLTITEDDIAAYEKKGIILESFYALVTPILIKRNSADALLKLSFDSHDVEKVNLDFITTTVEILRNDGWTTDQIKRIFYNKLDWSLFEKELNALYDSFKQIVLLARFIIWVDVNKAGDEDISEYINRVNSFGAFHLTVSDTPEKFGLNFILEDQFDRLLVERDTQDACNQHIILYLNQQLKAHSDWPSTIQECLQANSLQPLFRYSNPVEPPGDVEKQKNLDELFYQSEYKFDILDFSISEPQSVSVSPLFSGLSTSEDPGIGINNNYQSVPLRQGIRGRIAELYVLNICWQTFLTLDEKSRQNVLEAVKTYYEKHDRYKEYRRDVFSKIDQYSQIIANRDTKANFFQLLDLTGFGLAGFDVIVPQHLWPVANSETAKEDIYCVEIKAVYTDSNKINAAQIMLTTHEYRVANQSKNYAHLLRLIAVPPGIESSTGSDYSTVKFIRDIDLGSLAIDNMKDVIFNEVRGGHFPLRLSW